MKIDERTAYLTRDGILKLLSDDEVARVSTAEVAARLSDGDEYLDLGHLDLGVRRALGTNAPMGRVLPRKAVHEKTWGKILTQLAPPVIAHEEIALAAYSRYLSRGLAPGDEVDDWLEAERNLRARTA
jgi:hypothetical protein